MDNDKLIKDAQYRKGLSIAFFNATNAAITLVQELVKDNPKALDPDNMPAVQTAISVWRNWFLTEHQNYYANVIAKVGVAYKPEETKAKLSKAKTIDELKSIWLSLSEDERRDKEIIAFTQALKKTHEKAR